MLNVNIQRSNTGHESRNSSRDISSPPRSARTFPWNTKAIYTEYLPYEHALGTIVDTSFTGYTRGTSGAAPLGDRSRTGRGALTRAPPGQSGGRARRRSRPSRSAARAIAPLPRGRASRASRRRRRSGRARGRQSARHLGSKGVSMGAARTEGLMGRGWPKPVGRLKHDLALREAWRACGPKGWSRLRLTSLGTD